MAMRPFPWHKPPPGRRFWPPIHAHHLMKGDLKYLVLDVLREKPMHGYEIMTVLSDRFSGYYFPSPGAIYPALEMLEDMGYVQCREEDGKKVYSITAEGQRFLGEKSDTLKRIVERRRRHIDSAHFSLLRECAGIARSVAMSCEELTPEQTERVRAVLREAQQKIRDIIVQ